jgi:hypothetical protein
MSIESENRKRIVNVAKSYIGTVGGSSAHADILHFFNTVKPQGYTARKTDFWCAEFASACAIQAFGKKDAKTFFPLSASCQYIIKVAKAMAIWVENDAYKPKAGDWIIYAWSDTGKGDNTTGHDHVGIVEKVKDDVITVIEGNVSDKCKRRTIKVNGKYIRGFATPHYERIKAKSYHKTDTEIVKEVLSGEWGNGAIRKNALTASGYDYTNIQKEVTRITKLTNQALEGKYGVGADRVKALGDDYDIVQWNINRILKDKEKEKK